MRQLTARFGKRIPAPVFVFLVLVLCLGTAPSGAASKARGDKDTKSSSSSYRGSSGSRAKSGSRGSYRGTPTRSPRSSGDSRAAGTQEKRGGSRGVSSWKRSGGSKGSVGPAGSSGSRRYDSSRGRGDYRGYSGRGSGGHRGSVGPWRHPRGYPYYRGDYGHHHHNHVRFGFHFGYHYYPYFYYPYYRSYFYYYSPFYWPYYYPWYYYPPRIASAPAGAALGALDLNVKPKKAEVYLDGDYIGVVDNFDGFPTYLWLREDSYDLVFYKEGYETVYRTFSIRPGAVIKVNFEMVPGESIPPQELVPPSAEPRGAAYGGDSYEPRRGGYPGEPPPAYEPGSRPQPGAAEEEPPLPEDAGRLRLTVSPVDAAVYLDEQFVGTGEVLSRVPGGLVVEPGDHVLEVSRPGYRTKRLTFSIPTGGELTLEVELESEPEAVRAPTEAGAQA